MEDIERNINNESSHRLARDLIELLPKRYSLKNFLENQGKFKVEIDRKYKPQYALYLPVSILFALTAVPFGIAMMVYSVGGSGKGAGMCFLICLGLFAITFSIGWLIRCLSEVFVKKTLILEKNKIAIKHNENIKSEYTSGVFSLEVKPPVNPRETVVKRRVNINLVNKQGTQNIFEYICGGEKSTKNKLEKASELIPLLKEITGFEFSA